MRLRESRRGPASFLAALALLWYVRAFAQTGPLNLAPGASVQGLEGPLSVVWGDPHPQFGSGGEARYTLTLADGTSLPLDLRGQEAAALAHRGRRVRVSGRVVRRPAAQAAGQLGLSVDTMAGSEPQVEPEAAVFGSRRVIFLLVKFPDDATVPHPPVFYTDLTNPATPPAGEVFPTTINAFFTKTSFNQFSWLADVGGVGGLDAPGGWLTLPHPKSFYAPCGFSTSCAQIITLADDATALGRAQGIDFRNYSNINFVLSNDLDCCAWGGSYFSTVDGKSYGATWEPPWGQDTSVYAHEMGHSIGLPHSGWLYYSYDSPWDVMSSITSARSVTCGSYNSINGGATRQISCNEPGDGYIAPHKDALGWIPPANQVVTDTSSSVTVSLEADALPLASSVKMIKICLVGQACTGSTAHYFTVEARVKGLGATSQYDNGIPGEGVIIHDVQLNRTAISGPCYFNSQSGWAVPVDATPGDYDSTACTAGGRVFPNYALQNAQWTPGQTYVNNTYGVRIAVLSRSGSTFAVSVFATSAPPTITSQPVGQKVLAVQRAVFIVAADGAPGPAYQWQVSTNGGVSWGTVANGGAYSGATTAALTVVPAGLGGTQYRAVATNAFGSATSNAAGLAILSRAKVSTDMDGDGRSEVAVFRPGSGLWYTLSSSDGYTGGTAATFGAPGDIPVPGDYDGDGLADLALYRPADHTWYVHLSSTGAIAQYAWGTGTDIPVPGDYDGDGRTDPAMYRPQTGEWHILLSGSNYAAAVVRTLGLDHNTPVPADYDADGKTDLAEYRASTATWYIERSSDGSNVQVQWGLATDIPVPGDYDGDGKADIGVYRPSSGTWHILRSTTAFTTALSVQWGSSADVAVPADYDGDGLTDLAVFRPASGTWFIRQSTTGFTTSVAYSWGSAGDVPAPGAAIAHAVAATRRTVANLGRGGDLDSDGRADVTVYRPSLGNWLTLRSGTNFSTATAYSWGSAADLPVPDDFDGDGATDFAVYRPSTGQWFITTSSTKFVATATYQWGSSGDVPVRVDLDGDGKADLAVYRPATGTWLVALSTAGYKAAASFQWGASGDVPVPGDFDGDGKTDVAVFRPAEGTWLVRLSSGGYALSTSFQWGGPGDTPVPADYDGDGVTDPAVYRPSTGQWLVRLSSTGFAASVEYQWGFSGDVPVPGDYDGDGRTDPAVYRPSSGTWLVLMSGTNFASFLSAPWGLPTDVPILKRP